MNQTKIRLSIRCAMCTELHFISVEKDDFDRYKNGEKVQNAFPYLNDGQRELIISQLCNECFDKMFPDE